jgi:hypothetical protein
VPAVHAILILAAALGFAAPASRAPSVEEQRLYDEGLRAFQAGDARGAQKAWKAGYAIARDPAFLVHIGEAEEKAGAPLEAADSYRRYLREAPDAADRADIEQRLARLASRVPAAPPIVVPTAPSPDETPGEFGASPARPSLVPPPAPAPSGAPAAPIGDAEHPNQPTTEDSGWNRYNITAVATASAAVLLLGTAALFAAQANSDESDVNRLVNYRDQTTGAPLEYSTIAAQYEQATADGPRHDRYAKIALAASGVVAAVSVTFFVLDAKLGAAPAVAVAPAGKGFVATGGWQWRF